MDAQEILRNRPPMPWWVEIVATTLLGTLGLMYANYHSDAAHASEALGTRVTAVEAKQATADVKLSAVDGKTDHIQTQVDKLVEWALGKK